MRAAVVRAHGGPEQLNIENDFPDPRPGEGDVVVAVKAASLNYHDVFTRRGMPGIKVPMPAIMGLEPRSGRASAAGRRATACWSIRSTASRAG
jgi:alcohol dehydrogenase